jgi:hypothetical protein
VVPDAFNLWDAIPEPPRLTGSNLWDQVERDMAAKLTARPSSEEAKQPEFAQQSGTVRRVPASAQVQTTPASTRDWLQPVYQPGGLWDDLDEETLLLRPEELSWWHQVANCPPQPLGERPGVWENVWQAVNEETLLLRTRKDDIWEEVKEETVILHRPTKSVWDNLHSADLSTYRPVRIKNWALKPLRNQDGEPYFILKNVDQGQYVRLTPQQRFLWNLCDGKNALQDMVIAYLIQYQVFDVDGLLAFLKQLDAYAFLANPRVDVYAALERKQAEKSLRHRLGRLLKKIFYVEISVSGIDRLVTALYRAGGFLFFQKWAVILLSALTLVGFGFFLVENTAALNGIGQAMGNKVVWEVVASYIILALIILVHESAHALTVKHYKREVRRGGVLVYMGMIGFFVDTTDIWLSPRRARLAVSWNGPFSGFVLAGLFSTIAFFLGDPLWKGLLFQSAMFAYISSAFQLNPLLTQDGYYILMDWLEIPRLRERATEFVRKDLWGQIKSHAKMDRDHWIFTLYGALALLMTGFSLFMFLESGVSWVVGFFIK